MTRIHLRVPRRKAIRDFSSSTVMARETYKQKAFKRRATMAGGVAQRRAQSDMANSLLTVNMELDGNVQALTSIHNKLSQLSKAHTQPFICKVQKPLRNINPKAYKPEIIAIGPYHHGKDDLKMMEKHKVRCLKSLLQRNNEINVERCISAVAEIEQEARDYYAEPISLTKAEFIEMLVLDGCFIIELLLKRISWGIGNYGTFRRSFVEQLSGGSGYSGDNDPIFETQSIMTSLERDLILFENQIPFSVLCKLFDLIVAPKYSTSLMDMLANTFLDIYPIAEKGNRMNGNPQEVKHLLHLLHSTGRPDLSNDDHINVGAYHYSSREYRWIHAVTELLKHMFHSVWRPPSDDYCIIWYRTATELKNANVNFRKRVSGSLFEVKFENGIIHMPPLRIEDSTECFFRNLIAYEQYFPKNRPTFVADYVVLMNCLIKSSRDVEILSQCRIIDNRLGDNEVVANMFNRLGDSVTPGRYFAYDKTIYSIDTHCKKRWNRAWATLNRDYFNSPWAFISFFAAHLLLLLTVAQTVFSALQVFNPK